MDGGQDRVEPRRAGRASSRWGDKSEVPSIVPGHAYTLLSACEANGVKLLRLRNPWGDHEWTGDWSDKSNLNELQR